MTLRGEIKAAKDRWGVDVEGNTYFEVSDILGEYEWEESKMVASNHKGGGWHLPTKNELNRVYKNLVKSGISDLGKEDHWSSTEKEINYAWYQRFSDGLPLSHYTKNSRHWVRAVRSFKEDVQ